MEDLTPTKVLQIAAELIPESVHRNFGGSDVLNYFKNTSLEEIAKDSEFSEEEIRKFMNHTIPCMEQKIYEASQANVSDWGLIWTDW